MTHAKARDDFIARNGSDEWFAGRDENIIAFECDGGRDIVQALPDSGIANAIRSPRRKKQLFSARARVTVCQLTNGAKAAQNWFDVGLLERLLRGALSLAFRPLSHRSSSRV